MIYDALVSVVLYRVNGAVFGPQCTMYIEL